MQTIMPNCSDPTDRPISPSRRPGVKRLIQAACIAGVLTCGIPAVSIRAADRQGTDSVKGAGKKAEDAGKEAGKAAGQAGKAVGSAAKEAGKGIKAAVTGKPKRASGVCKDGTHAGTKSKKGACSRHGGSGK